MSSWLFLRTGDRTGGGTGKCPEDDAERCGNRPGEKPFDLSAGNCSSDDISRNGHHFYNAELLFYTYCRRPETALSGKHGLSGVLFCNAPHASSDQKVRKPGKYDLRFLSDHHFQSVEICTARQRYLACALRRHYQLRDHVQRRNPESCHDRLYGVWPN